MKSSDKHELYYNRQLNFPTRIIIIKAFSSILNIFLSSFNNVFLQNMNITYALILEINAYISHKKRFGYISFNHLHVVLSNLALEITCAYLTRQ